MFRVGNGYSPQPSTLLSKEGQDFLTRCLVHDPNERESAEMLLGHPFVKVTSTSLQTMFHPGFT